MSESSRPIAWRGVEAAAVLLVLAFFLYATRGILNPLILFALLWAVLLPFRGNEGHAALLTVAGLVTLIWVLSTTGSLLAPFILAVMLAYVLDPLVDRISRGRISRTLGIFLLALPALGLLAVVFLLVVPAAIRELGEVVQQAPVFFQRLVEWLTSMRDRVLTADLPLIDEEALIARLEAIDGNAIVTFLQERTAAVGQRIWSGVLGLGRGIGTVFTVIGYVALTPVLTFYLLRDWDRLTRSAATLVPEARRASVVGFAVECDRMISRYLRGQLTVAIAMGVITGLGLWIARFPYAGTLGLIVGVFSVVPYLGLVLSLIPAIFIALVSGSVLISLLKVAVVYGASQLLEASVISPRIVGESVGLHPVFVLLALSLGGFFFGFVGLLLGVPAAAIGKLLVERALRRYKSSDFYRGDEAPGV
jgi:predicted PurR-regulated permease PerM